MPQTDLLLLRRYAELGDEQAFAELVRQHAQLVLAASRRVLGDQALAEDVTQETFYRLMRKPEAVSRSVAGWLHRTATQLAIDLLRSRGARAAREAAYARLNAEQPDNWSQFSEHIDAALAHLDEPTRDLLVEHFLGRRSQRDLAAERGVSPATVSRQIQSGLERLRAELSRRDVGMSSSALGAALLAPPAVALSEAFALELGKLTLGAAFVNAAAAETSSAGLRNLLLLTGGATVAVTAAVLAIIWLVVGSLSQPPKAPPVLPPAAVAEMDAMLGHEIPRGGFLIIPGRGDDFDSRAVAVVSVPDNTLPSSRVVVAFRDGHVQPMTVGQVEEILQQQLDRGLIELLADPRRVIVTDLNEMFD